MDHRMILIKRISAISRTFPIKNISTYPKLLYLPFVGKSRSFYFTMGGRRIDKGALQVKLLERVDKLNKEIDHMIRLIKEQEKIKSNH